jgi:hypothetical protein
LPIVVDIIPALTGLKYLRDFATWVGDLRKDADVLTRTNEAMARVGEVQDKLYELREENIKLLEENQKLNERLRENEQWEARLAGYSHFKTPGGASVLLSKEQPEHYVCPQCAESLKQLHRLQGEQVYIDKPNPYQSCTSCKTIFRVGEPQARWPVGSQKRPERI